MQLNVQFASKQLRRSEQARMPMERKLEAVVKLQQLAAPILRKRGKARPVWNFGAAD